MGAVPQDDYPTPQPLADEITKFLFELFPQKKILIEPACGEGNFIRPSKQLWTNAYHMGIDIFEKYRAPVESLAAQYFCSDFLAYAPILKQEWLREETLVLGNPPYSNELPQRFVEVISQNARPGCHIALLLRQGFLGGIGRALRFKERSSLLIKRDIAGRPKFNPNSKNQDHSEYAVYIYEVGYKGHYTGWEDPLIWKPSHLKKLAALKANQEAA
jgi:hypothetical protein